MTAKIMRTGLFLALLLVAGGAYAKGRISGYHNYGGYGLANYLYQWEIGDNTNGTDTRALGTVCLTNANVFGYNPQLTSYGDIAMLSDRRVLLSHRNAANVQSVSVLTCLYDSNGLLTNCVLDWTGTESGRPITPLPNGAFACHRGTTIAFYNQTGPNTWAVYATPASPDGIYYDMTGLITPTTNEVATGSYARDAYRTRPSGWVAKYDGGGYHPWGSDAEGEGLRNDLLVNGWLVNGREGTRPTIVMDGTETGKGTYNGVKGKIQNANGTDINGDNQWATLNDGRIVRVAGWGYNQSGVTWQIFNLVQNPAGQTYGSIGATGYTFQKYTAGNLVGTVVGDYMAFPDTPRVSVPGPATGVTDNAAWLVGALVSTGSSSTAWGIYWGTNDMGNTTSGWSGGFIDLGTASAAPVTNSQQVTGLVGSMSYYYRVFATNTAGTAWALGSFATPGAPVINNGLGGLSVSPTIEGLRGQLVLGNPNPDVWVYWGTTDGDTNALSWDQPVVYVGQLTPGLFTTNVFGLLANKTYWYRCFASNSYGTAWAASSTNFVTASPTLSISDATVTEGALSTTTAMVFTVTLSATSAQDVVVNFSASNGTAMVEDSDFVATNGTLTIPAGAVTGTITVMVNGDNLFEAAETLLVNLSSPVYATFADSQGQGTINNDDYNLYVRHGGAGLTNGCNWANAYDTLQKALTAASYNAPVVIHVQASGAGQAYDVCSRSVQGYPQGAPLQVTFLGGWTDVDTTPGRNGLSVIRSATGNQNGITLGGGYHGTTLSLVMDRFAISNVTRGIELTIDAQFNGNYISMAVSNTTISAANDGLYVVYDRDETASGGKTTLTAANVAIRAGLSGTTGDAVHVSGSWGGSSITADGTQVSTLTSSCGYGVYMVGRNYNATYLAGFTNLVVYGCASNGIFLSRMMPPYYGGANGITRASLRNCTIANNGNSGLQMLTLDYSGHYAAITNCIFANNVGPGVALGTNGGPVFACNEDYNVFFNDDVYTNGTAQTSLSANTSTADPLFKAQNPAPEPWYYLGSSASSAYKNATDGGNRGAYQQAPAAAGTMFLLY